MAPILLDCQGIVIRETRSSALMPTGKKLKQLLPPGPRSSLKDECEPDCYGQPGNTLPSSLRWRIMPPRNCRIPLVAALFSGPRQAHRLVDFAHSTISQAPNITQEPEFTGH